LPVRVQMRGLISSWMSSSDGPLPLAEEPLVGGALARAESPLAEEPLGDGPLAAGSAAAAKSSPTTAASPVHPRRIAPNLL